MPKMYLAEVIKRDPETNEILETRDLKGFGFFNPYAEEFKRLKGLSRFCTEAWAKYRLAGMYLPFNDSTVQLVPYDIIGVKVPDEDWKETQSDRLTFGAYARLPWHGEIEAIKDHFAHVSFNDPTKVAFTENEEKGKRDIQTVLTPTKYLMRYYGALDGQQIRRYAGMMQGNLTLRLASTREGFKKVYWFGPRSCMGGLKMDSNTKLKGVEYFDTDGIHPCETYASGDFAVAYIAARDVENDSEIAEKDCYKEEDFLRNELKISARALVDTKNNQYVRIYDDGTSRLETLLAEAGYTQTRGFDLGLRLLRLENNSGDIIAPYMDGDTEHADERGDYLILNDCGEYTLEEQTGLVSEMSGRNYCEYYEERGNFEVYNIADRNEYWSEMAIENGHAFYCEGECEYYSNNTDAVRIDGRTYCEDYARENFSFCEGYDMFFDGATVHPYEYDEDSGEITEDDSYTYCEEYADNCLYYSSVFECYFRNSSDLEKAENDDRLTVKVYDVADGIGVLDTFRTITLSEYMGKPWRYTWDSADAETGKCIMAHEKSMLQAAE